MTLDNLKKHHARLKWLASGEFTERDFDYKVKKSENPEGDAKHQGDGGWCTMGDFQNAAGKKRKELIIHKAKRALEIFEKKYPEFKTEEKPEPVKEEKPKSKGNK